MVLPHPVTVCGNASHHRAGGWWARERPCTWMARLRCLILIDVRASRDAPARRLPLSPFSCLRCRTRLRGPVTARGRTAEPAL